MFLVTNVRRPDMAGTDTGEVRSISWAISIHNTPVRRSQTKLKLLSRRTLPLLAQRADLVHKTLRFTLAILPTWLRRRSP